MDRINELSDDLLIKILSFVPTKVSVSTSILSKRWEFLWMWVPKLEYFEFEDIILYKHSGYRELLDKNLPLHRAPIIESLTLRICLRTIKPEDIKLWVGIAVSRCVRELRIGYYPSNRRPDVVLPSSLYTCKSLVMMELTGEHVLVDVPPAVCLPSLKTLQLRYVTYLSEDSLRLLLSCCSVLEDLDIKRHGDDNVETLVVVVPSLRMEDDCSYDGSVIDTPSLKYLKVTDLRYSSSYSIKHMPKLEEAYILTVGEGVKELLESITSVKRLSLEMAVFKDIEESMYRDGIVFTELEHLKLRTRGNYWSKLLFRLLNDSPKLRVLNVNVYHQYYHKLKEHEPISWSNEGSSIPECLLTTLETLEFSMGKGTPQERDFLSFISKTARCLKSTLILR